MHARAAPPPGRGATRRRPRGARRRPPRASAAAAPPSVSTRPGGPNASAAISGADTAWRPPPAATRGSPTPRPLMPMRGGAGARRRSTARRGSNCEPTSRRASARGTPPMSCRNATQANEPSSSMSIVGRVGRPPGAPPVGQRDLLRAPRGREPGQPPAVDAARRPSRPTPRRRCPPPTRRRAGGPSRRPQPRPGSMSSGAAHRATTSPSWRRTRRRRRRPAARRRRRRCR